MRQEAISTVRPRPDGRFASALVAVSALFTIAACTPSTPAPAQAKPTATRAAGPGSPAPVAKAAASPSPRVGPQVRIADASLGDSTPWLSLRNTGDEAISVAGWRVEVGDRVATIPDETTIEPGMALTLHPRNGVSTENEVFLGADGAALTSAALPGTPVRLVDTAGRVVAETTVPRF